MKSKMNFSVIIFFILTCCISNSIDAQYDSQFEKFTIKDGLSNNNLWDVIQDQFGFLWIATKDGLNYYDGYSFKVFKNSSDDSTSLPTNDCNKVFEDSENNIWIGTKVGLAKFDRVTETFKNYQFSSGSGDNANAVWNIIEDSLKNLWLATNNGVLSFDRDTKTFQTYDLMKVDNTVAPFINTIGGMLITEGNELYVGSVSFGFVKFDYSSQIFIQTKIAKGNYPTPNNVFAFAEDKQGNIWIGTVFGVYKYNPNDNSIRDISPFEKVTGNLTGFNNGIFGLYMDRNQNMWVGTSTHGIYVYNFDKNKFQNIYDPKITNYIGPFYEDDFGIVWAATSQGLLKYDLDKKPFEIILPYEDGEEEGDKFVITFAASKRNDRNLWLGTSDGMKLYDIYSKSIISSSLALKKINKINGNIITSIIEDEKYLWFGTPTSGLFKLDLRTNSLKNYKSQFYDNNTINNDIVNTLLDNNEDIWLGTGFGINIINKKTNQISSIPSLMSRKYDQRILNTLEELKQNSTPIAEIQEVGDFANISKDFVLTQDQYVLIASVGEGLRQWNMVDYGWLVSENEDTIWTSKELYQTFHAGGNGKNRNKIGTLKLKKGRYKLQYVSDDSHSVESFNSPPPQDTLFWGISIFNLNESNFNELQKLIVKDDSTTYTEANGILKLIKDSKGIIWAATNMGLCRIDPETFEVKNYRTNDGNDNSISSDIVNDIIEDNNGNLWIATDGGLNLFYPSSNKFSLFSEKDGLPTNSIRSIVGDNNGDIWIGSTNGISKIEISAGYKDPIIINYDVKDGLQGYEFESKATFKDENGKLYFSGLEGFNVFLPRKSNTSLPKVALQNIMISNKSIKDTDTGLLGDNSINQIEELDLPYDKNDLSFEFVSIHYARPDKNRLQYKMEGIDEDWILSDRHYATYTNLSPGDYVFNVKGSNGDGIWNDKIKQVRIHIAPPWYNNWIAYIIYAALFLGLLYGIRKFEMGRQQKNAQIKESKLKIEAAEAHAKAAESDRRALQADFEHKKKELEEARQLQLSMLPRELPQLPNLDIAVYMKTATEVGGDYYDFHIGMDGTLTVVLGDATGHGMKAGTMVTTTKSLFNVLAPNPNIVDTFHEMTRCLKLMHMQNLSMCMTMLKIIGNKVQMSAAGMPPIFIYNRVNQSTEEHVIKGMPLGTFANFPYKIVESELKSGDAILLMSDGFPELMNENKELFGYKRTRNLFEDLANESPDSIITKLKNAGAEWVNDKDPEDDVTFVVIKIK